MPWTHFTAPLAEGQILTRAMRAELLAALDERLKAVDPSWGVQQAGEAGEDALAARGLATRRLYYRGPASTSAYSLSDWHTVAQLLSSFFLRPKFVEGGTGSSGTFSGDAALVEALVDLGALSTTPATWTGTALDTATYWNMVREVIRMLRWRYLFGLGAGSAYTKAGSSSPPGSGLASAVADYIAASETASVSARANVNFTGFRAGSDETYNLGAVRQETAFSAPASGPWLAGWRFASRPTFVAVFGFGYIPVPVEVLVAAQVLEVASFDPPGVVPWAVAGADTLATGLVSLEVRFPGYFDGANWSGFISAASWSGDVKQSGIRVSAMDLAGRPAFTHP